MATTVAATAPEASPSRSWWRPLVGVAALIVVGGVALRANRTPAPASDAPRAAASPQARTEISAHPGTLDVREVWLNPGEDHIRPADCGDLNAAWGAPDRATFVSAMERAGLSEDVRSAVLEVTICDNDGCIAVPPSSVLAGLTQPQRIAVYEAMRDYPQAMLLNAPFVRPSHRMHFADDPRLSPAAREVLRAGSFVIGERRYFSDLTWLCERVTDTRERASFFRVLRARSALDATVRVRTHEELERAVRWWGTRGREDEVRTRFTEAMTNGTEGVPLRELLPPFARTRFGTFPARDTRFDCFWTAVNFFSATEEGGPLIDSDVFDQTMSSWIPVPLNELRFGDVLAFRTEAGLTEHAAVYLAEDLVLTKDGWTMHRAWEMVRIARERRVYPNATQIVAYRRP